MDQASRLPGCLTGARSRQPEQGVRAETRRGIPAAAPQGLPASAQGRQQHSSVQQPLGNFVQTESTAEHASEEGGVCTKKLFLLYLLHFTRKRLKIRAWILSIRCLENT